METIERSNYDFFHNIRNIRREVDENLMMHDMTEEDILYVVCGKKRMSKERFLELADRDYDSEFFEDRINALFYIVCINLILFYDTNGKILDSICTKTEVDEDFPLVFEDKDILVG